MLESISSLPAWLQPYFTWLSALTLGEIWFTIYNPPNRVNLTVALVVLYFKLPTWVMKYNLWKNERKVVEFGYPAPKVSVSVLAVGTCCTCTYEESQEASKQWEGTVIENPNLLSHLEDESLLPPETGLSGSRREHITCYDPSTGVSVSIRDRNRD